MLLVRDVITVLFAQRHSIYKGIPGLDVWDEDRDARKWAGGRSIIAHPPCAQWSRLKAFARKDDWMKSHAPWSVNQVRRWGGVLEHPSESELWDFCQLPKPGALPDEFGGYSLLVDQCNWGHLARKRTWLYIVGCPLGNLPGKPTKKEPTHLVDTSKRGRGERALRYLPKSKREGTPLPFAQWLVQIAQQCRQPRIRIHVSKQT